MIFQRQQYIDKQTAVRSNGLVNMIGCNKRLDYLCIKFITNNKSSNL